MQRHPWKIPSTEKNDTNTCKNLRNKSREIIQRNTKWHLPEKLRIKEKESNGKCHPKKQNCRGCVPSAPCRGREHERETVWIIIGQKEQKTPLMVIRAHPYRVTLHPLISYRMNKGSVQLCKQLISFIIDVFRWFLKPCCDSTPITLHASSTSNEDQLPHTCLQPKQNSAKTITTHTTTLHGQSKPHSTILSKLIFNTKLKFAQIDW